MTARLTLLCGPSGSGKTTWARSLEDDGATVVSIDRLAAARNGGLVPSFGSYDLAVYEEIPAIVAGHLQAGRHVVVDETLSYRTRRDRLRAVGADAGANVRLVVFSAPRDVLASRVSARRAWPGPESVPVDVDALDEFLALFEWPGADEPHELRRTG